MNYLQQQDAIADAADEFPSEFGLSAWPGERFKISRGDSYHSGSQVMLYTHIRKADGTWEAFCKGTVAELKAAVRA